MPSIKIGRVRPYYRGAYNSAISYEVLDRVAYGGSIWECAADAPAGTAPQKGVSTFWVEIGAQGEKGTQGATGATGPEGPQGAKGETGPAGVTPALRFKVVTLDPGTLVTVSQSGTVEAPEITLGIPRGNTGEPLRILGSYESFEELETKHPTANIGDSYTINDELYTWVGTKWHDAGTIRGPRGDTGVEGPMGPAGPSPEISAEVSSDRSDGVPAVVVSRLGTEAAPEFHFAFSGLKGPQGVTGPQGATGPQGPKGDPGSTSWDAIQGKPELYNKAQIDELIKDSTAGADSVELCQQIVGLYNGLTGSTLDYRDYLNYTPTELLNICYGFGRGYFGETK